jgi:putative endonuclease
LKLSFKGEKLAAEYLIKKGYEVIKKNYRYNRAETDIICRSKNALIFVEVKTRSSGIYGLPEQSIARRKIEQLIKSAEGFISEYPEYESYEKRFDVIAIQDKGSEFKINHIENAFTAD